MRRALLAAATLALAASGFGAAVSAAGVDAQDVGDITEPTSILAADSTFPIITATGANADYTVFNVTGPYPNFSFSRSETNNRSSASSSFFSGELALYSCGTVGCGVPPDTIPTASLIASGLISGKTPLAMTGSIRLRQSLGRMWRRVRTTRSCLALHRKIRRYSLRPILL